MSDRLFSIASQILTGVWEGVEEAAYAHRLTPTEVDDVCRAIRNDPGTPPAPPRGRPQDGSDQPTIPLDDWGFPIPQGTSQPTLW